MMNSNASLWWGPPKNFNERKNERKISWLELFFDLVYVAAIGQITHSLSEHPAWSTLGFSFLLFSMLFWSWVNGSQYYDLHGSESIRTRLFTFVQMLAVAAAAITVGDAFHGDHHGFVIAFSAIQIIITYLWWSVGLYDPSHRVFNIFYTVNYLIALALLVISYFTYFELAIWIWGLVLLLDLTPGLIGARTIVRVLKERGQVFTASEAIVERFGLFTIIVLAESILGTVTGIAEIRDKDFATWLAFMLSLLISFLLWSLYFDMTSEQETKTGYQYMQWLVFLHFPLLASFGILGACMKVLLASIETGGHHGVLSMFCISIAVILGMIVAVARIMKEEEDRSYIRPVSRLLIIAACCIICLPLFLEYLQPLLLFGIVAVILVIPVFIGVKSWVHYKFFSKK